MSESENFIKKGTTLFTAKPFAYVLYSKYRNERCDYCFKRYILNIFKTFLKNFNLHNIFISSTTYLLILLYYNNINYFI